MFEIAEVLFILLVIAFYIWVKEKEIKEKHELNKIMERLNKILEGGGGEIDNKLKELLVDVEKLHKKAQSIDTEWVRDIIKLLIKR